MIRRIVRSGVVGSRVAIRTLVVTCGIVGLDSVDAQAQTVSPVEMSPLMQSAPATEVLASPQSAPGHAAPPYHLTSRVPVPITSIHQLLELDSASLDALYRSSTAVSMPVGKVKGRVLLYSGTRLAKPASKVARLMWQGKIFKNDESMAVNRFFGVRMIKGRLYEAESWLDGGPSLILDYQGTSWLYASYRDEIREVGPGIYLGLMYSRTQPEPTFKMHFALEAQR